jgi:hypothetical protein
MAAAVLAASLASCGSDLTAPIAHTWQLQTVNNGSLPATIPHSTPAIIITSGTVVTNPNGTYTISLSGSSDGSNGVVGTDQGDWTITSSTFFFNSSTGGVPDYIAALNSGSIRVALPGQLVHSSDNSFDMVFAVAP